MKQKIDIIWNIVNNRLLISVTYLIKKYIHYLNGGIKMKDYKKYIFDIDAASVGMDLTLLIKIE